MNKNLSDMTLEELWRLFPIVLKEHDPAYFDWYETEKKELLGCLPGSAVKRISHIGSSAVKGLVSKPTVDILLEIDSDGSIDQIVDILKDSGWLLMSQSDEPYVNRSFNKGYTQDGFAEKVYHLHVRYYGNWDEFYFRDYLIAHEEAAKKYAELKLSLMQKYKNNRDGYTDAKTDFIKKYTDKAREEFGGRYKPEEH